MDFIAGLSFLYYFQLNYHSINLPFEFIFNLNVIEMHFIGHICLLYIDGVHMFDATFRYNHIEPEHAVT